MLSGIEINTAIRNHNKIFPVGYIIKKVIILVKNTVNPSLILLGVIKNLYITNPNKPYKTIIIKKSIFAIFKT